MKLHKDDYWFVPLVSIIVVIVALMAWIVHEPEAKSAPPTPPGPIMPAQGLHVELVQLQPDFVETLLEGRLYGCDLNGDLLCDGADIQPFVDAELNR